LDVKGACQVADMAARVDTCVAGGGAGESKRAVARVERHKLDVSDLRN
jgi:hypothetical protein